MRATAIRMLCLALPALAIAACGPLSAHASLVSFQLHGAGSPVGAVKAVVRGYYDARYSMVTCSTHAPRHRIAAYAGCPLTPRLRQVLLHPPYRVDGGLPFSRSQSAPRAVHLWQLSGNRHTAHVDARWDFGPRSFTTTFVVRHLAGGWLVDNEYCAGHPGTSLYDGRQPCT